LLEGPRGRGAPGRQGLPTGAQVDHLEGGLSRGLKSLLNPAKEHPAGEKLDVRKEHQTEKNRISSFLYKKPPSKKKAILSDFRLARGKGGDWAGGFENGGEEGKQCG